MKSTTIPVNLVDYSIDSISGSQHNSLLVNKLKIIDLNIPGEEEEINVWDVVKVLDDN